MGTTCLNTKLQCMTLLRCSRLLLLQGSVKFPLTTLRGIDIKRTLREQLVVPVLEGGDHVHAFRVVWRVEGEALARAWDHVVRRRRACDQVVARSPSLHMYVSCITGVFSKGGPNQQQKPIYPAVSYWTVFDGAQVDNSDDLMQRLATTFPDARVKPITSVIHRHSDEQMAAKCQTLFVALKDHAGGFVGQKISRSRLVDGTAHAVANTRNAKLAVVSTSKYQHRHSATVAALQIAGLMIDSAVLEGVGAAPFVADW